ncbi:DUF2513 domain-containing protein [Methanoregula sp.]|uniref:DUF2513 domain-containing protein n=1 Tax=Methanoregula sp. TaxID=2052170 RepID=UPI003BB073DA
MKRDMDLVRKILLAMEANPQGFFNEMPAIEGYSSDQVGYHVYLMMQAGLVEGSDVTTLGSESPEAIPSCLTWQGHDFLDASRDDNRWTTAKEIFRQAGGVSFEVAKEVLAKLMMTSVTTILSGGNV